MKQKVKEGIHLFNSQKFFEAHEALEEVWLKTEGEEKLFLHGLIQIAAAFHHYSRGNSAGFRSLLEKGLGKLKHFEATMNGVDLANLRQQIQPWRDHLTAAHPSPSAQLLVLPRIRLKN